MGIPHNQLPEPMIELMTQTLARKHPPFKGEGFKVRGGTSAILSTSCNDKEKFKINNVLYIHNLSKLQFLPVFD